MSEIAAHLLPAAIGQLIMSVMICMQIKSQVLVHKAWLALDMPRLAWVMHCLFHFDLCALHACDRTDACRQ